MNPIKKRKTDGDVFSVEGGESTTTKKGRIDGAEVARVAERSDVDFEKAGGATKGAREAEEAKRGEGAEGSADNTSKDGNLDRRKPIIQVTIVQHQLATLDEIKEAEDKGTPLEKFKDNMYYSKKVKPVSSRHVILDRPEKANELTSKYGPKSKCLLFMNDKNVHPNKYNSSAELMDLLHFHNIGNYLPNIQMFFVDTSILARDNIYNLCENSLKKNYRIVHHILLHMMVGYEFYGFNNLHCYNCIQSRK